MSVINTNVHALTALSNLRRTNLHVHNSLEKLSSGFKVNKGADDPSGLAIAVYTMNPVIRGIDVAIQNSQDHINLIQTADGALEETLNILHRMRDLAVRSANEAPLNGRDRLKLQQEFLSLRDEINRKSAAITFNTKQLFARKGATAAGTPELSIYFSGNALAFSTQVAQVGYGNQQAYRLETHITMMDTSGLGLGVATTTINQNFTYSQYAAAFAAGKINANYTLLIGGDSAGNLSANISTGVGNAQRAIDTVNGAIDRVAQVRGFLGTQQRRIEHIINDMAAHHVNLSAARSRIMDTDMAAEISAFTKSQILQQSGTAILAQANAQPQSVLQLLQ